LKVLPRQSKCLLAYLDSFAGLSWDIFTAKIVRGGDG